MAPTERSAANPQRSAAAARRALDETALARVAARLSGAPSPPWLHGEVARRMAERLPVIRLKPGHIIDWGAFLGASHKVLAQAYPQAHVLAVEPGAARRDATAAARVQPWWSPRRWVGEGDAAVTEDELAGMPAGQAQLLWANMALQGSIDPQAVMRRWQRALAVDGFLMFSTLGPGSLGSLRDLYTGQGWPPPFAAFVDMHDLGDMLIEAGFADPVMDQEQITLTWPSAAALLAELRQLGGNVHTQRHPGLRTPRWRGHLLQLLDAQADSAGRVALNFELVYGHAFKPLPRPRLAAKTALPLDDMRAMVRAGRGRT